MDDHEHRERQAHAVLNRLRQAGFRALIAGGAVRDRLLGRTPGDYDVATSALPDEVMRLFPRVIPVGERFGVVLVRSEGVSVEVATFRKEVGYRDGRRPDSVVFSADPREDALRRDFTVNGLFLDPATGRILDFVGGRRDLDARVLRAIGDPRERFGEDYLRLLRAVRFAGSLEFELEAETYAACREMAPGLSEISGERIRDEVLRIITDSHRGRGLRLLRETGMLAVVLPEVDAMVGVEQPPEFHPEGDVFTHTVMVLEALVEPGPVLALGGLLHDVGKPPTFKVRERIRFDRHAEVGAEMTAGICRRLRLSREVSGAVVSLVREHLKFMSVQKMRTARLKRFLLGPLAEEHLALHKADCLASHGRLGNWRFCVNMREKWLQEPPAPKKVLSGRDLIALGLRPGPRFAVILGEIDDLVLEGVLADRESALRYVRAHHLIEGEADA